MEKDEKLKALDAAISQIEKQFGKGAVMKLGDPTAQMNVETIPTGSLSLDIALGLGGIEYIVAGAGLNVRRGAYPPELAEKAGAIEDFTAPPARRTILVHYLAALEKAVALLEQQGFAGIREAYCARSCTLGSQVQVTGSVNLRGTAEALDGSGALLVRTEDGVLHRVLSGDVSVRGVMGYV